MADNTCPGGWIPTVHTLKARTDKEAQSKVRRRFENAGLTAMSLVAVPTGENPNVTDKITACESNKKDSQ